MIIILFGPPGAGKGTQSEKLARELNVPAVSTGDIFRKMAEATTPLAQEVKAVLAAGDLVNDDLVNRMVAERLDEPDCANGVILDGYPRTVSQAETLDKWLENHHLSLDSVIELAVNPQVLVERRAGRLYAPTSKRVYHERFNPPKVAGKCDISGETLVHRDDDQPEVVRHRLDVYREQTSPVIDYYRADGRLHQLDGMKAIDDVYADILEVVRKAKQKRGPKQKRTVNE